MRIKGRKLLISKIIAVLVSVSFVFSLVGGRTAELSEAVLHGAQGAVELIFSMLGMMCLWSGVIKVMDRAGVTSAISRFTKPFLKLIYPGAKNNEKALGAVSASFAANLLGLGNAALPLGLCAMENLDTADSFTFAVLATVPIQLFPTTLITLRRAEGSVSPYSIILPIWITSVITYTFAAVLCRISAKIYGKGNKK